ncbi:hypothetical protein ACWELP_25305 [Rhodococcus aetherivorans]
MTSPRIDSDAGWNQYLTAADELDTPSWGETAVDIGIVTGGVAALFLVLKAAGFLQTGVW